MELIPKKEVQRINYQIWENYTPEKMEMIDGMAFWGDEEAEKLLLMMIYNLGLEKTISLLPDESKQLLKELLSEE